MKKWWQPGLQLHLVTKFRGRRELGLPTLSAAVHPWKMMLHMMFQSMQTFCEQQIYQMFPLFCTNRPFHYFRLLMHFTAPEL